MFDRSTRYVCLSSLLLASMAGHAQTNTVSDGSLLDEVIVTATKRGEESAQEIPISIQVFNGDEIANLGMQSFEDYARLTPGVSFTKRGPGQSHIVIRGLSSGNVGTGAPQNRSLVAMYLDDVPFQLNGYNFDPELFDTNRIEVLKGPQGTLFGDSAMAGAIRYVTQAPDTNEWSSRLNVSGSHTKYGEGNGFIKGMLNMPVVDDRLGLRGVAYYRKESGWIDNIGTGEVNVNDEETWGGRLSALFKPHEDLRIQAFVLHQETEVGGRNEEEPRLGPRTQTRSAADPFEDRGTLANLTVEWDAGPVVLTSVTGYLDRNFEDTNIYQIEQLFESNFGTVLPNTVLLDPWKQEFVTQEFRLSSTGSSWLQYTVGAFFADMTINYSTFARGDGFFEFAANDLGLGSLEDVYALGCGPELPDHFFCGSLDTRQKQYALFGELSIRPTDKMVITLGARYFDWKLDFDQNYGGLFNGGPTSKQQTIDESDVNPKVAISYAFSEGLFAYASAAKGFRLGGVNDPLPPSCNRDLAQLGISREDVEDFDSDSLWSYELGAKKTFAGGRALLNGAVFYSDWTDIQTTRALQRCGYTITLNSGNAISQGAELSSTMLIGNYFKTTLGVAYTDAEIEANATSPARPVAFVPKWTGALTLEYAQPVSDGWTAFGNLAASYRSDRVIQVTQTGPIVAPASAIGSLRLGVDSGKTRFTLFVDNLWNERTLNNSQLFLDVRMNTFTQPLTVGLEADFRF